MENNECLNTDLANIFKEIEASAIEYPSEDDIKVLFEDVDTTSNRLGGEFFTPQTVSKLLARLVIDGKKNINKVYEKTCWFRVIIMTLENSNSGYMVLESIKKNKRICFL